MVSGEFDIDEPCVYVPAVGSRDIYERSRAYLTPSEALTDYVPNAAGVLARYYSTELDVDFDKLKPLMDQRLQYVSVYTARNLSSGDNNAGPRGQFDSLARVILLATDDLEDGEFTTSFTHEIVHASLVSGHQRLTYLPSDAVSAMNGIDTEVTDTRQPIDSPARKQSHAKWENEGLVDTITQEAFRLDPTSLGYKTEVSLLRAIQAFVPNVKKRLLGSAVLGHSKGAALASIEDVFGPLWLDTASVHIADWREQIQESSSVDVDPFELITHATPRALRQAFHETWWNEYDKLW